MSEEVEVKEEVVEEVIKDEDPDLYQIFVNGNITPADMFDHIQQVNGLPYGSSLMIWLSSPGGYPQVALMFDEKLKAKGINASYISHLFTGSAGCTLPQLSDTALRLAYHHSVFTFHGATVSTSSRKETNEMLSEYAYKAIDEVNDRMMKSAGLTKKEFKKYNGDDIVLYGYEILDVGEHGFIDGLILKELSVGKFLIKTRDGNKIVDVSIHKRSDLKDLPLVE